MSGLRPLDASVGTTASPAGAAPSAGLAAEDARASFGTAPRAERAAGDGLFSFFTLIRASSGPAPSFGARCPSCTSSGRNGFDLHAAGGSALEGLPKMATNWENQLHRFASPAEVDSTR